MNRQPSDSCDSVSTLPPEPPGSPVGKSKSPIFRVSAISYQDYNGEREGEADRVPSESAARSHGDHFEPDRDNRANSQVILR